MTPPITPGTRCRMNTEVIFVQELLFLLEPKSGELDSASASDIENIRLSFLHHTPSFTPTPQLPQLVGELQPKLQDKV